MTTRRRTDPTTSACTTADTFDASYFLDDTRDRQFHTTHDPNDFLRGRYPTGHATLEFHGEGHGREHVTG